MKLYPTHLEGIMGEMDTPKLTKPAFRQRCLEMLRTLSDHNRHWRDKKLSKKLERYILAHGGKSVLLYWPLGSEPDVRDVIHRLRRRGVRVYLPFMEGSSFRMVPFRFPLKRKQFGIYEPGDTKQKIKKIDIAIVPAVGVDAQARRVGFGKGMYDRFFAALKKKPATVFVQLEACMTNEKICDEYDVSADVLLTPRACYRAARILHDKRNSFRRCHCDD